jgi:predicted nucleic acid-binding Zn ribbon protein
MKPVSNIIFSIFRGTAQHDDWVLSCLEGAWPTLVGERLASACRPRTFKEPHLIVEVIDPEWVPALKSMKGELLAKIEAATGGEVRSLELALRK